jgi:hypothetical protein
MPISGKVDPVAWHLYRRVGGAGGVRGEPDATATKRSNTRLRRSYSIESDFALQKDGACEKTVANCSYCAHGAPMSERAVVSAHTTTRARREATHSSHPRSRIITTSQRRSLRMLPVTAVESDAAGSCCGCLKDSSAIRYEIERQPKAADASSLPTARQDRRSAPARRGVRLVRDQGQRYLCLGPARLGRGLPSQDRRDSSAAGNEEAMRAQIAAATAS